MPRKRLCSGNGSLTGGTGDVNPQWLSSQVLQAAADVAQAVAIPIPINKFQESGNMVTLVEILKVYWDTSLASPAAAGTYTVDAFLIAGTIPVANSAATIRAVKNLGGRLIDYIERSRLIATVAGEFETITEPVEHDLTDSDGHGVLVATDTLQLLITTNQDTPTTIVQVATCRILYRFKNVGLAEYIGIVQSQNL